MYMAHVGDWNFWIFVRQMLENTFAYVYYTYWNSARTPAMQHMKGVLPEFLDMCMAHVGNPPELLHTNWNSTSTPLQQMMESGRNSWICVWQTLEIHQNF